MASLAACLADSGLPAIPVFRGGRGLCRTADMACANRAPPRIPEDDQIPSPASAGNLSLTLSR